MKSLLEPSAALARVPGIVADSASIEELKGGLTNRIYRVQSDGRQWLLRLNGRDSCTVQPDRSCEHAILEAAGIAGIAPAVHFSDPDAGILVTEFLEGRVWQAADLHSTKNIEALAELLRRVHALPLCGTRMNLAGMTEQYLVLIEARKGNSEFATLCARIVNENPTSRGVACCHNDIVAANVIDAAGLKLIDWEYACDNEPMFDLASAIGYHDIDVGRQRILLDAYAGAANAELKERLAAQVRIFDAIQWLWLAARQSVSPNTKQARRLDALQERIR